MDTLHKALRLGSAILLLFAVSSVFGQQKHPDIRTVAADLHVPEFSGDAPAAGKRVRLVHPNWEGTGVYAVLYLPTGWQPGKTFPVIAELPGNGGYRSQFGDACDGTPEGCRLGYGMSAGQGAIWLSLPFLNAAGDEVARKWWGVTSDRKPRTTVRHTIAMVEHVCREFGGDRSRVLLAGFSRGAIACNAIGLSDDSIAGLWCGMVLYSHYDGVLYEAWTYPDASLESAALRLGRLKGRPQFVCHEGNGVAKTRDYLEKTGVQGDFTFRATGFRNHNAEWILRPCAARDALRRWMVEKGLVLALHEVEEGNDPKREEEDDDE